jgi:hypothetical protein
MNSRTIRTTPGMRHSTRRTRPVTGAPRVGDAVRHRLNSEACIDRRLVEMEVDEFLAAHPEAMAYAEAEVEALLRW